MRRERLAARRSFSVPPVGDTVAPAVGGTDGQASHLPGLVGKAGEAAAGADARSRGRRARRALDDVLQSRDHHARAPPRAHARGRLRRVRVRPGRLDDHQPARIRSHGIRSGFSARQRRLRSRPLRRRPRHAPDLHPPRERREASDRSPRPHLRPLRRSDDARRDRRSSTRSSGRRSRTRAASPASRACGGSSP